MNSTLSELKEKTVKEKFWENVSNAQSVLKRISIIQKELALWEGTEKKKGNIEDLIDILEDEEYGSDESLVSELITELTDYEEMVEDLELKLMLSGKEDFNNALMSIHPGAGGTESQDWAEMLYRMYMRWTEKEGFSTNIIDFQPGDEAGIKDITIEIKGEYAYGLLKAEVGVHRLVRISPFDASSRRHTSFASVFVYPEVDDDIEVEIIQDDLRIDTYRASGAGGQHVNKTDSAVRITHIPTGIVVQCQNERSQHKNKANALKVLKARLYRLMLDQQRESVKELEEQKQDIGWGSQIRSYVFHPYIMVKDHRTNVEVGDGKKVLDGDLNMFIRAFLLMSASYEDKMIHQNNS